MDKNTYLVVVQSENGKHIAYVQKWHNSNNIAHYFHDKITSANICATKKEAEEIAEFWNKCYVENGTYMYA